MRLIYASKKGGKPLRLGMNQAKRIAHASDRRDQLIVQRSLGNGLPRQHHHHQELVKRRHQYYGDVYEQTERLRLEAQIASSASADAEDAGDADRALPEPPPGTADQ